MKKEAEKKTFEYWMAEHEISQWLVFCCIGLWFWGLAVVMYLVQSEHLVAGVITVRLMVVIGALVTAFCLWAKWCEMRKKNLEESFKKAFGFCPPRIMERSPFTRSGLTAEALKILAARVKSFYPIQKKNDHHEERTAAQQDFEEAYQNARVLGLVTLKRESFLFM